MKKLVLSSVCTLVLTGAVFAQGNVNWGSITPAAMTAQTNATTYSPLFGGGSTGSGTVGSTASAATTTYYYELLYNTSFTGSQIASPATLSSLQTWIDTGLSSTNSQTAGRLQVINPNTGAQVAWSPGVTNNIMLVGWSANLGTTWAAASNVLANWATLGVANAYFGESTTGFITTLSTATVPGASVFGTSATAQGLPINSLNTQLFLIPVPEPTTIALAGLGAASLLIFRRRKA